MKLITLRDVELYGKDGFYVIPGGKFLEGKAHNQPSKYAYGYIPDQHHFVCFSLCDVPAYTAEVRILSPLELLAMEAE